MKDYLDRDENESRTIQYDTTSSQKVNESTDFEDNSQEAIEMRAFQTKLDENGGQNSTGIPDDLKQEFEYLYGFSLDDVVVHYNSSKPAEVGALAYTEGNHIYLAPGEEKHLRHELMHIIQQKQGRVVATGEVNGKKINDEASLEKEADQPQPQKPTQDLQEENSNTDLIQRKAAQSDVIQRKVGFEFETGITLKVNKEPIIAKRLKLVEENDWHVTSDGGNLELVTEPFEEEGAEPELEKMTTAITDLTTFVNDLVANQGSAEDDSKILLKDVAQGTVNQFANEDVYVDKEASLGDNAKAAPQVTGGVNLENIPKLMQLSTQKNLLDNSQSAMDAGIDEETGRNRHAETLMNAETAAKAYMDDAKVSSAVGDIQGAKLEGLVSLIYVYLFAAKDQARKVDQAKYPFPMMTRMNFLAIYNSMNADTQALFDPALLLKNGDFEADAPVYGKGFLDVNDKPAKIREQAEKDFDEQVKMSVYFPGIKAQGATVASLIESKNITRANMEDFREELMKALIEDNRDYYTYNIKAEKGPNRIDWLTELKNQSKDLMSSAPVNDGMYASSPAMGEHDQLDPDHVGNAGKLIQIELRKLEKGAAPANWLPLAKDLFKLFQEVQK